MGALAEAGVELVGENRLQELEAKQRALGRRVRVGLHRQPAEPQGEARCCRAVRLIHSVASDSALEQLERHGTRETEVLVEVNVAGEQGKGGIEPGRARRLHRALPGHASRG